MPSSIVLINPKYVENLATVVRAAACFDATEIWYTGNRVDRDVEQYGRLRRELRMKAYAHIAIIQDDRSLSRLHGTPVAVEFNPGYVPLPVFKHPKDAVYVFGPEDGSIERPVLCMCHHFVQIPTQFCLNLAMTVNIVLYDRVLKEQLQ